jgi:hypothetical protein
MTLNTALVDAALGEYYRQNREGLITNIYYGDESTKYMTKRPGVKHELVGTGVIIDELHQAFQPDFLPKSEAEFTPIINSVYGWMIDLEFKNFEALESKWMGWTVDEKLLAKGALVDTTLGRFLWSEIIKKAKEERELLAGSAERVAPTTGVAGAANAAWDGFLTVISDVITAGGGINVINTGGIGTTGSFAKVEGFMRAIPVKYRNATDKTLCSYKVQENVAADFRVSYPYQSAATDGAPNPTFIGTMSKLQPLISFGTSERLLHTAKDNFLYMFDFVEGPDTPTYQIIPQIGKLQIRIQGKLGYGFDDPRKVYVNDQV